jgi:hypothetical protein
MVEVQHCCQHGVVPSCAEGPSPRAVEVAPPTLVEVAASPSADGAPDLPATTGTAALALGAVLLVSACGGGGSEPPASFFDTASARTDRSILRVAQAAEAGQARGVREAAFAWQLGLAGVQGHPPRS